MKSAKDRSKKKQHRVEAATRYQTFNLEIQSALRSVNTPDSLPEQQLKHLLNGAASAALNQLVSKSVRTSFGIFFSGQRLAKLVASRLADQIRGGATVADPTCGAGDLLLSCMALAPTKATAEETVASWEQRIIGVDIHPEFVATTRSRLELLAATRSTQATLESRTNRFPLIVTGDFLEMSALTSNADCVVMNPPFGDVTAPEDCVWSSGKVQQSALFVDAVVKAAKAGQEIVAILPDVLRSGTRYARWRTNVSRFCDVIGHEIYGRFDPKTDVDVFILHLKKRIHKTERIAPSGETWNFIKCTTDSPILSDLFTVSVGSVVPHRHKGDKGQWREYLCVDSAPIDEEASVTRKRRFEGRLHAAPFVVLRRTSSPGDARRAIPCLITGRNSIAVENHLIVLQPNDGLLSSCRALMKTLQSAHVNEWLDQAIRCRHLTTSVLKELPLFGWKK